MRFSLFDDERRYEILRKRMVKRQLVRRGIRDARVLAAMAEVPRHLFVPPNYRHLAYSDRPLPIGEEQTISQPYIVALMSQLLCLTAESHVLEIGVGSGYQTAILSYLVSEVVGIERISTLAERASRQLTELGYDNVAIYIGDGSAGYEPEAPYDAILIAAASPSVPDPLLRQLGDEGRLIIPVGEIGTQTLHRITRHGQHFEDEDFGGVRFVPLIGGWGFAP